jgi:hypothetical protein
MPKKVTDTTTFQVLEQEAYHAFLEWPLFLIRRIKQLQQHLAAAQANLPTEPRKERA